MTSERPGVDNHKTVSDTEVNEALEKGDLGESLRDVDKIEHDDGQRSPGPVDEKDQVGEDGGRRPPRDQDVTAGEAGKPVEPPD
jgi:hypothetical protein